MRTKILALLQIVEKHIEEKHFMLNNFLDILHPIKPIWSLGTTIKAKLVIFILLGMQLITFIIYSKFCNKKVSSKLTDNSFIIILLIALLVSTLIII